MQYCNTVGPKAHLQRQGSRLELQTAIVDYQVSYRLLLFFFIFYVLLFLLTINALGVLSLMIRRIKKHPSIFFFTVFCNLF